MGRDAEVERLRRAVKVAVVQLYGTDPLDVAAAFTVDELQAISDATAALQDRQVEDIYREALGLGPRPTEPASGFGPLGERDWTLESSAFEDPATVPHETYHEWVAARPKLVELGDRDLGVEAALATGLATYNEAMRAEFFPSADLDLAWRVARHLAPELGCRFMLTVAEEGPWTRAQSISGSAGLVTVGVGFEHTNECRALLLAVLAKTREARRRSIEDLMQAVVDATPDV